MLSFNIHSYALALGSNYVAMAIAMIVQLLMIPIYLSTLGIDGYGIIVILLGFLDFISLGVMWVSSSGLRIMGESAAKYDFNEFSIGYSIVTLLYAAYGIIVALLFSSTVLFLSYYHIIVFKGLDDDALLQVVLAFSFFIVVYFSFDSEKLAFAAAKLLWVSNLLQSLYFLLFFVSVYLLLKTNAAVHIVFVCMALSLLIVRVIAWHYWRYNNANVLVVFSFPSRLDLILLRRFCGKMSVDFAINSFLVKIGQLDILILGWLGGPSIAGLYALLAKVPDFIIQLLWRISTTAEIYFINYDIKGEQVRLLKVYQKGLILTIMISAILSVFFLFFGQSILIFWVGDEYAPKEAWVYWLASFAGFWMAAVRWPTSFAHALLYMRLLNWILFIEGVIKVMLIFILFDEMGYLSPFLAINIEFSLGLFFLYLYLGRAKV